MRKKVLGFTLIELMIVVAIIAIIAAIAIPGLLRARISANEGSASSGLRSIASAQTNFQKSSTVDQDLNGTGEYGIFNELCGATNRRGSLLPNAAQELPRLTTTDLSVALQSTGSNYSTKSGYYLKMWIPGDVGGTIGDVLSDWDPQNGVQSVLNANPGNLPDSAAISAQENKWIAYAWPGSYRSSGVRAFVCNEGAEVMASSNTDPATNDGWFRGDTQQPIYETAMRVPAGGAPVPNDDWENIHIRDNSPANIIDANHTWLPAGS